MSGCVASVISSRNSLFVFRDLMFHCRIVKLVLVVLGFCLFIVGLSLVVLFIKGVCCVACTKTLPGICLDD